MIDFAELRNHGGDMPSVEIDGDEDACIFYTSGTTGRPKGAQLTQRGCVLNVMNIALWAAVMRRRGAAQWESLPEPDPAAPGPVSLVTTPLFHVTANNCVSHPATLAGGTLIFMYKWDAGEARKSSINIK